MSTVINAPITIGFAGPQGPPGDGVIKTVLPLPGNDYTTLRAASVDSISSAGGAGGTFYPDTTDTSSADDGMTVIVAADGTRWKRADPKPLNLLWHEDVTPGSGASAGQRTANNTALQAILDTGQTVYLGHRLVECTGDEITFDNRFQRVFGFSAGTTVLSKKDGGRFLVLGKDTNADPDNAPGVAADINAGVVLNNFRVLGPGGPVDRANPTAAELLSIGFEIDPGIDTVNWNGDGLTMRNVTIESFGNMGMSIRYCSKFKADAVLVKDCFIGCSLEAYPNNCPILDGISPTDCDTGLLVNGVYGGQFDLQDFGGCRIGAHFIGGNPAVKAGELESCTERHIVFEDCTATLEASRTLRGAPITGAPILAKGSASVTVLGALLYDSGEGATVDDDPLFALEVTDSGTPQIYGNTGTAARFTDPGTVVTNANRVKIPDNSQINVPPVPYFIGSYRPTANKDSRFTVFGNTRDSASGPGDNLQMATQSSDGTYYNASLIRDNPFLQVTTGLNVTVRGDVRAVACTGTTGQNLYIYSPFDARLQAQPNVLSELLIYDAIGNASTQNKVIKVPGGATINGSSADVTISTDYGAIRLGSYGGSTNWVIISQT